METKKKNIYEKLFELKKVDIKLKRDTQAYSHKYATLSQIQEKLGEHFEKLNLLITHRIDNNKVITRIIDLDDLECFIESGITLSEGVSAQNKGSEITYYRRYNLLALLDLEVEDDDGKSATDSFGDDNKAWFNDANFKELQRLVYEEGQVFSIQDIRKKYKVANKWLDGLRKLGIEGL